MAGGRLQVKPRNRSLNNGKQRIRVDHVDLGIRPFRRPELCRKSSCAAPDGTEGLGHHLWRDPAHLVVPMGSAKRRVVLGYRSLQGYIDGPRLSRRRRSGAASTGSTPASRSTASTTRCRSTKATMCIFMAGRMGFRSAYGSVIGATDNSVTLEIAFARRRCRLSGRADARAAPMRSTRPGTLSIELPPRPPMRRPSPIGTPFVFHAAARRRRARPPPDGGGGFLHAARPRI